MKIAFIVRRCDKRGGIARYVAELASQYEGQHEVHVFAHSHEGFQNSRIHFHHIPMLSFSWLTSRKLFAVNNIFEVFSFLVNSYYLVDTGSFDIVHSQGDFAGNFNVYTAHSCHRAWLKLFRSGRPGAVEWLKKSLFNPLHALVVLVELITVKKARVIVAISHRVKDELVDCYPDCRGKIEVIPHGVDTSGFDRASGPGIRQRIRGQHGIANDDFAVIFPAHEFHRKGLMQLISALKQVNDPAVKILVVGRDDARPYQRSAAGMGCADQVVFAGETSRVGDYFKASDALVFPTIYEPFGLIVLEAMASALPVVVSRIAGASELIHPGVDGLLIEDPLDSNEIARHLEYLLHHSAARAVMGAAARATAEKYSWAAIADQTMRIYTHHVMKAAS